MAIKLLHEESIIKADTSVIKSSPIIRLCYNISKFKDIYNNTTELLKFYEQNKTNLSKMVDDITNIDNLPDFIKNSVLSCNKLNDDINIIFELFEDVKGSNIYADVDEEFDLLSAYDSLKDKIKLDDVKYIYSLFAELLFKTIGKSSKTDSIKYYCTALSEVLLPCVKNTEISNSTNIELNTESLNNLQSYFENMFNFCKKLQTVLGQAKDVLNKLINYFKKLNFKELETMKVDTQQTQQSESYIPTVVRNKKFDSAQDAYNNMLISGKLARKLRECTIENLTEKDLSRAHEDRRNGYNRIDLTHKNGTPLSIFVYYNDKLIFRIEAYDDFGGVVSGQVDLHLTRGTINAFLNKVGIMINSLAKQVDKGNILSEK